MAIGRIGAIGHNVNFYTERNRFNSAGNVRNNVGFHTEQNRFNSTGNVRNNVGFHAEQNRFNSTGNVRNNAGFHAEQSRFSSTGNVRNNAGFHAEQSRFNLSGNTRNNVNFYAERNRFNSTQSLSDTQMYERMTSMITTAPPLHSQAAGSLMRNNNPRLTNGGRDIILNSNNAFTHTQDANTLRLMSARNQLADHNIARASVVGNRNRIVNQYQNFMRQGAHSAAKYALNRMV